MKTRVRSARARAAVAAAVTVLALALGACAGAAPGATNANPATCLPHVTSAADYQRAFDARGPVWSGGDGALPITLPDGRVLWLFGDTFSGLVVGNRYVPPIVMVRNSAIVQTGRCFQPLMGGTPGHVADLFPQPAPDQWYWPVGAWVDPSGTSLHVFVRQMRRAPGPPGWDWTSVGMRVATMSLPDLTVRSVTPLPFPTDASVPVYGTSVTVAPDGYAYVYGSLSMPGPLFPIAQQYVARVPAGLDGPWEFWDGTAWSSNSSDAAPMVFTKADGSPDDQPNAPLNVIPYGTGWLGSAKRVEIISPDVTAWYAPAPQGPWQAVNDDDGSIALTPVSSTGLFTYGGHVADLPIVGPVVIYNVNGDDVGVTSDAGLYGPRVVPPVDLPSPDTLAAR